MEYSELIFKIIFVIAVFAVSLLIAMYSTYAERKIAAFMQDRIGPDRAGPFGILQPLADGVKMFMKEEIIPSHADKALFILGPSLMMLTACMTGVVIPWGNSLLINGREYILQITDVNIGILYIFAVVSIGVYGIMIGGWASNNKYSLLGGIRSSAQMISYELTIGLSLIGVIMMTGSLSMVDIVNAQSKMWNLVWQPLGFLIYSISAIAEVNRCPFDIPEAETELVAGYHTEYSSMKFSWTCTRATARRISFAAMPACSRCRFTGRATFRFARRRATWMWNCPMAVRTMNTCRRWSSRWICWTSTLHPGWCCIWRVLIPMWVTGLAALP